MRLIDNMSNVESFEPAKIKTHFAEIIVGGTCEKPCYHIMYFDPTDREYHIGFSSFCLEYVFKWLSDEFEIIDEQPTIDARPVVRGEWIKPYINFYGHPCHCCSVCGFKASWQDKNFCPECGADMRPKEESEDAGN